MSPSTVSERLIARLANELQDGAVVATGVASPLAILAIGVAQRTHAPKLTYLACVGALNPRVRALHGSSEDLRYLEGRSAEITIPDLFDHARRGRIDTVFFGAAEVDGLGRTNLSAVGTLAAPRTKFPGVAGACTLRRWCKRPVLVVPKQGRRNLVPEVQIASTRDERQTPLITDLGVFQVGPSGARLEALDRDASVDAVAARTGFPFQAEQPLHAAGEPTEETLAAIRQLDPAGLRDALVGAPPPKRETGSP